MLYDEIQEAVAYIRNKSNFQPRYGIILGTGLGNLVDKIEIEKEIPYRGIPHFPESTVQSHRGKLYMGTLNGFPVAALAGRFHYYEGHGRWSTPHRHSLLQDADKNAMCSYKDFPLTYHDMLPYRLQRIDAAIGIQSDDHQKDRSSFLLPLTRSCN